MRMSSPVLPRELTELAHGHTWEQMTHGESASRDSGWSDRLSHHRFT
jgi:hypothetical protein